MKKIICSICFIFFLSCLNAQNITAAEYFFDTDPGTGAGTSISVGTPGINVNFSATISTASLSPGFHILAIRTKDASNKWGLFETRAFYISVATNDAPAITGAEYFLDTDPGPGAGIPASVGTAGNTVNFIVSLPTSSLANGFHTLGMRVKDAAGHWGLFETRAFYISSGTANSPAISAAEYFIDNDPGVANGSSLNIGAAGNTVNFTASIPTTTLSNGFHTLAIRIKNANGKWGLFETRAFYISRSAANIPGITGAEYFIDADPGLAGGTPLNIGAPGNTVNFTASIATTSLANGFHTLAIRTKNSNGQWGLFETKAFYISSSTANTPAINAAEYFIDADPGVGNGTSISTGTGNAVSFTASIPTTSLTNGFHTLAIRTRNINGQWGLFETRAFYISVNGANMGMITAAEYFLDTDPGVGNGSVLSIATPGNTVNQTFLVQVPGGTTPGQHMLSIRTKDINGKWGLFEMAQFNVGTILPLNWVSFTGQRVDKTSLLKWTTENEVNTSHFNIERSRNGIDFTVTGNAAAKGNAHNEYSFIDPKPLNGVNFYRLKQIDIDGQFKYSSIIKIYFDELSNPSLLLYPNPAHNNLSIEFAGHEKMVAIEFYDASGKMVLSQRMENKNVLNIPVAQLSQGTYWILVSDGITKQKGSFVKTE